jgi:hypothetical protein
VVRRNVVKKQVDAIVAFVGRQGRAAAQVLSASFLGGVAGLVYAAICVLVAVVADEWVHVWVPPLLAAVPAGALGGAIRKAPLGALVAVIVIGPFAVAHTWDDAVQGSWWMVAAAIVFIAPAGALGGAVGRMWFGRLREVGDKVDATGKEKSGGQLIRVLDRFVPRIEVNNWLLGFVITSCVLLVTGYFYHLYPPRDQPLQAVVFVSVIGEVFLLRVLGFRAKHMLIPLVVLLGMMADADSASFGPHSVWAFFIVLGFKTVVLLGVVILAEAIGSAIGR